jgi:hypothetical protein
MKRMKNCGGSGVSGCLVLPPENRLLSISLLTGIVNRPMKFHVDTQAGA